MVYNDVFGKNDIKIIEQIYKMFIMMFIKKIQQMEKRNNVMRTTIRTISEATGFSPATVSNALNNKRGVNPATTETIMRVARELEYFEEPILKRILFVMYKTNGLITDDTPFFNLIMDGFQNECKRLGFEMVMQYLDRREEDFEKRVHELTKNSQATVVLVGAELMDEDFHFFENAKCTLLTLDYWNETMDCNGILINNEDAVIKAIHYLAEKGHEEIGYLRGAFRIKAFEAREAGYQRGMSLHRLTCDPANSITVSVTMDGAYQDMQAYLRTQPKLPTAFFADNDMIALGCMKAMLEAGIQIPEQVSIVGFDDLPFSEISTPRLTSLRVPKQAMGEMAVQRIVEMRKAEQAIKTKILVCPDFIERDSVKENRKRSDGL